MRETLIVDALLRAWRGHPLLLHWLRLGGWERTGPGRIHASGRRSHQGGIVRKISVPRREVLQGNSLRGGDFDPRADVGVNFERDHDLGPQLRGLRRQPSQTQYTQPTTRFPAQRHEVVSDETMGRA